MDCYKITPFNLLNVDTFFYMKKFLQMLSKSISKKGFGFEKYLIAFCMLISVQGSAFAQYTFLNVSSGVNYISEGIVSVNPGDEVTLTVPYVPDGTSVKWEYRTKPKEDRRLLAGETGSSITLTNIQEDVEYIASYESPFGGSYDARILISCVSFSSSATVVCPNEAVQFNYTGGQFADKGKFEQKKAGPAWHLLKDFPNNSINQWILNEKENDFSVRVSLDYSYYSAAIKTYSTDPINVTIRTDCKAECLTTSTGDYYVGTDFDPNKQNASKIPEDVVSHFADYEIGFEKTNFSGYWLGNDASSFFGQDPAMDVKADAVGKNNYLFAQGNKYHEDGTFENGEINDDIVKLRFQVWDNKPDPNKSGVKGKAYRYKMRMYIQADQCHVPISSAWENARFKPETEHGRQTNDCIEAYAYDNETGKELGHKVVVVNDGQSWINFKDIIDLSSINTYTLIRFEVTFYGSFPKNPNVGLDYFVFTPRFEQFGCVKLALDYISAEIENVCLLPQVLCAGEYTTAHAAGFPKDAVYRWYKKTGNSWVEDATNYNVQDASFKAEKGIVQYQLRVTSSVYESERVFDFSVSGNDCTMNKPTEITGGTFCLPNTQSYTPNMVDHSKEVTYEWTMYKPDNTVWFDSKKTPDPHFQVYASSEYRDSTGDYYKPEKADSLVVSLNLDDTTTVAEGDYKLQLRALLGTVVDTVLDTIVHIYRTPDITLKLTGDKYTEGMNEEDKTICPSDRRREIQTFAENSFDSPMLSKYIYTWNSEPVAPGVFIPDPSDSRKATVNLAAIPGICDGDLDNVQLSVQAYIGGCADADTNKYKVEKSDDPTIDCKSLEGRNVFYCESKKESANVTVPIPNFTSGCDSDPDIIIEYTSERKEVKDTMGTRTIVVRKSEINDSELLHIVLPWGVYNFKYTIKDGCGKTVDCTAPISVEKGYPDIPCDEIIDLDVINGRDSINSSKCAVKFDVDEIPLPTLLDRNSENDTILTGEYAGRIHFVDKQDKNVLKTSIAKFDMSIDLFDEYDIDYTYILWKFTNGDKSSYCVQEVLVRDTVKPFFDCATIVPFEYRPFAESCEIEFKEFKNFLYNQGYTAYDSCPEPVTPIPGELHEDSVKISKVDDSKVFLVGIPDTLYWQFRDRHDNLKYCPQVVNPRSSRPVVIDCKTLEYFEGTAKEGTCYVDANELNIPNPPYGKEACLGKNGDSIDVKGVGTRSDGKALDDPYPAGNTYITWLFDGKNSEPVTCETHVFVHGVVPPVLDCDLLFPKTWYEMPNCDSMEITLETKKVADPCVAGFMSEGIPYMNGKKIELKHKFPIGESFVTWKFWDYTKSAVDSCIQSIHLRDTEPPVVDCDTMKDDSVILHGKCSIPFEDLRDSIGKKVALEYCTRDTIWGVPYLINDKGERMEFPSEVSVGIYPIRWIFANDSLTTEIDSCEKTLYLLHDGAPIFDCSTLTSPLQLLDTAGLCKVILNPDKLPIPEAVDSCKRDYPVYGHGYVQLFEEGEFLDLCYFDRDNNKAVYLMDLPLGGHLIKWVFKSPYSIKPKECEQLVKVKSYALDSISCDSLVEYVHVVFRRQGEGATFQEVVEAGLKLPVVWDPCHVLDTIYTRDDGKSIYDIYPVGKVTEITWLFKDTTKNAEGAVACSTKVEVQDQDVPACSIPVFKNFYACLEGLPPVYNTYEEFRKAGGMLVSNGVDVSNLVDPSTFKCDTMSLGDKCDYTFRRTYTVKNLRDQTSICVQEFKVKDTVPPVWLDGAESLTKVFDCEAEDFFPTNLKAKDECSGEIFSEYHKVNSLDGIVDGLFYTVTSNRSSDPRDCNYYNYEEVHRYIAVDRCRNRSERLKFVAQVQDTFAPVINMPDTASWRLDTIPAVYARSGCKFLYPDLVSSFPKDSISDICDPAATKYFKITQTPAAGTVIENTKETHYVTLHITDPCGLEDTVMKAILVQDKKEIVNIKMSDTTLCANFNATLMDVKKDTGFVFEELWFSPGKWGYVTNNAFEYDFYKGEVKEDNLIYSNNKSTYAHRFTSSDSKNIVMNSMSREGLYSIVVMDTIRQCFDTASAYITIHAAPSVWLYSAPLVICEKDSIHLISDNETLYEKYKLDVNDNGEEITEEGWMVNGVKYIPETLLEYTNAVGKLQYYAINRCEKGTSKDWISLSMRQRMSPDNLMLTTEPNNPARVYLNESAKLSLVTKYKPDVYMWYRVKGIVDGNSDEMFDKYGDVREEYMESDFEQDTLLGITNYGEPGSKVMELTQLGDSAQYYVLLVDSVCPAVPSNIVSIDVVQKLPTAFTPHNSEGLNDIFMEGHKVVIFNRYGQKMVESDNGWDGTSRGDLVDPGVYFYEVIINDGEKHRGSIEVVYFK